MLSSHENVVGELSSSSLTDKEPMMSNRLLLICFFVVISLCPFSLLNKITVKLVLRIATSENQESTKLFSQQKMSLNLFRMILETHNVSGNL